MIDAFFHSGRDVLLFALPSLVLLVVGVFGLEETLVRPKVQLRQESRPSACDANGEPILTDPDGRIAGRRR